MASIPARYETALLDRRRLLESHRPQQHGSSSIGPASAINEEARPGDTAAAFLACRAETAGLLACAVAAEVRAVGSSSSSDDAAAAAADSVEYLTAFLEWTISGQDRDVVESTSDACNDVGGGGDAELASMARLAARGDESVDNDGTTHATRPLRAPPSEASLPSADIDAFFAEYPECVREDYRSSDECSDGSSSDDESESDSVGRGGGSKREQQQPQPQRHAGPYAPQDTAQCSSGAFPYDDEEEDACGYGSNSRHPSRPARPTVGQQQPQHTSAATAAVAAGGRPSLSAGLPNKSFQNPYSNRPGSSGSIGGGNGGGMRPGSVGSSAGRTNSSAAARSTDGWDAYDNRPGASSSTSSSSWNGFRGGGGGAAAAGGNSNSGNGMKKANPFQTAREFAGGGGGGDESDRDDDYDGGSGRRGRNRGQNRAAGGNNNNGGYHGQGHKSGGYGYGNAYGGGSGYSNEAGGGGRPSSSGGYGPYNACRGRANPYGDGGGSAGMGGRPSSASSSPEKAPLVRGGPTLSAGLKRKFQPPKRTAPNGGGGSGNGGRRVGGGGGGGTTARPSSSGSRIGGSGGGQGNDDDDEEELPEELKGLDKELVKKIMNEIVDSSGESVTFDDIAGLADAKQTVLELVCWPMKRPDLFTGLRRGPNGLLLFGPPGTGKTLIGKAIAHESGATFFSISSSSLTSKWIGEGEKLVRTLFAVAAYREPAVVFIDEIDSLLTQRKADENEASRRIKTEFLVQLDGTGTSGRGRLLCIGATNRPHELDDAARRRFVKRLYVPLPDRPDREILIRTLLGSNRHSLNDAEVTKLSGATDGFSGADLKALCTDAALGPIRELGPRALDVDPGDVPPISYKHFRRALKGMNPSVSKADLDVYVEFNETYGSKRATVGDDDDDGATEDGSSDEEDA